MSGIFARAQPCSADDGFLLRLRTPPLREPLVGPPRGTKRIHSMYVAPVVPSRSPRSAALTSSRCLMAPPSPRAGSAHPSGSAIKAGMTEPSADEGTSPRSGDDGLRHDTASRKSCPSALEDQQALTISMLRHAGHPRHASRLHDASPSRQHRQTKHPSASCQLTKQAPISADRRRASSPSRGTANLPTDILPRQQSRGAGRSHCVPAPRTPLPTTSTRILFRMPNWRFSISSKASSRTARQVSRIPSAQEHRVGPGPTPVERLAAGASLQDRGNPGNVTAETI
jgi:hypothetical protein